MYTPCESRKCNSSLLTESSEWLPGGGLGEGVQRGRMGLFIILVWRPFRKCIPRSKWSNVHLNSCSLWHIIYNSTKLLEKQLGQTKSAPCSDPPLHWDGSPAHPLARWDSYPPASPGLSALLSALVTQFQMLHVCSSHSCSKISGICYPDISVASSFL